MMILGYQISDATKKLWRNENDLTFQRCWNDGLEKEQPDAWPRGHVFSFPARILTHFFTWPFFSPPQSLRWWQPSTPGRERLATRSHDGHLGVAQKISKPCWFSNFSGMNIHTNQLYIWGSAVRCQGFGPGDPFKQKLVGGLEHVSHVSIYWEVHNPNWRTPSFFRGVGGSTTNQNS